MSPSKFDGHDQELKRSGVINGPRPSPLRLHNNSHGIQKPSNQIQNQNQNQNQDRKPVIIYTHSPKIIHTQARDFMALVQKLTGVSRTTHDGKAAPKEPKKSDEIERRPVWHEDNESSSVLTDENSGPGDVKESLDPFFADVPLFTPNSNDLFCSPRPLFRFQDMVSLSPNRGTSISPSFMDILRGGIPEY